MNSTVKRLRDAVRRSILQVSTVMLFVGSVSGPATAGADDIVLRWNEIAARTAPATTPFNQARIEAIVQLAAIPAGPASFIVPARRSRDRDSLGGLLAQGRRPWRALRDPVGRVGLGLFNRASVRVQTAGDAGPEQHQTPQREAVAPVIPTADVHAFLARLHPEFDAAGVSWQPPHDRALRRTFVQSVIVAAVFTSWIAFMAPWWWLAMVPLLLVWALVHARLFVAHLRWGTSEHAVGLRSGWLWRKMTIARFARIQVVSMSESPFDRRHGMASVLVDTFGASGAPHPLNIPYLGRTTARELHHRLIDR